MASAREAKEMSEAEKNYMPFMPVDCEKVPVEVQEAMDYALRAVAKKRPKNPLLYMSKKLREWNNQKKDAAAAEEMKGQVERVFALYDTDSSGDISVSELQTAWASSGRDKAEIDAMFAKWDKNGDAKISKSEFATFVKSQGIWYPQWSVEGLD